VTAARGDTTGCLSTPTLPEDSSQLLSALFDEILQLADSDPLLVEADDKSKTPKVSPLVSKGSLDAELASIALSIYKADKEEFDNSKYTRAFFRRSIKLQGPLFVEFGLTSEAFDTQELSKKAKSFMFSHRTGAEASPQIGPVCRQYSATHLDRVAKTDALDHAMFTFMRLQKRSLDVL